MSAADSGTMAGEPIEVHLIVGPQSPPRQEELAAIARALGNAGLRAREAGAGGAAADAVRVVWAEELDAVLAQVAADRERWLECAVIVNAARDEVLELLDEHGLLGAIEIEEPSDWEAPGRLFVRKDVVGKRGERIGGPGRDSLGYTLWSDPDAPSLAAALARYIEYWRETDSELVVDAEEARRGGLPVVEVRLKVGGTGLTRVAPEDAPGAYVALAGAPGGGVGFSIGPLPEGEGLEQAARQKLQAPNGQELRTVETRTLRLAGAEREAVCLFSEYLIRRTARCVVRIDHAGGALMAIFTARVGAEPSCEAVLANPSLERIARSLRVVDAGAAP
jgi:hypothetical protein